MYDTHFYYIILLVYLGSKLVPDLLLGMVLVMASGMGVPQLRNQLNDGRYCSFLNFDLVVGDEIGMIHHLYWCNKATTRQNLG